MRSDDGRDPWETFEEMERIIDSIAKHEAVLAGRAPHSDELSTSKADHFLSRDMSTNLTIGACR
jgi:hypothetical protein